MAKFMTVAETAEMLTLSTQQVYRLASNRQIPHVKVGQRLFFDPVAIDKWIEDHTVLAEV